MKKKIKIKGSPKAQAGNVLSVVLTPQQQQQWYKNQNMFGTPPAGPTAFNNPFSVKQPGFITSGTKNPNPTKSLSPSGMGPITADDYYANLAEQNTAAPAGTRFDANAAYAPGTPMPSDFNKSIPNISNNPFSMLGPMLMGELAFVNSAINKIDQRDAQRKFKDQFLSDNMYLSRPESISGNRGDYDINTGMFRPDEYVYGKFNKIAQMGGEMKRKVKITGLPQAAYGGTQNKDAVNQLYGNSAYMMNMFSQRQEQEPMQEYNETLQADPRSLSVIEAEKGETLVKTGENSTIPEFYKIGGKRHYEGGTPLGPDKATPNSFIYSDTKAMKIKDPELLASFGLKAKKGGYTPAEISKKFNLNDKNLREGLYDNQDILRKKTAIMNADKYISNLGKLALVQESKKGFPQGIPDIANPYMEKIGLDPMSFMPDQSQQNMMDNYGNLPMAQIGMSFLGDVTSKGLNPDDIFNDYKSYANYKKSVNPNISLPSIDEFIKAREQYNSSKIGNYDFINPLKWNNIINYQLTGQYEPMATSYARNYGEGPMTTMLRYGTDPVSLAFASPVARGLRNLGTSLSTPIKSLIGEASLPEMLNMGKTQLYNTSNKLSNFISGNPGIVDAVKSLTPAAAITYFASNPGSLTEEEQVDLLNRFTPRDTQQAIDTGVDFSSSALQKAAETNPAISDVYNKMPQVDINVPRKSTTSGTKIEEKPVTDIYDEYSKKYGGIPMAQNGLNNSTPESDDAWIRKILEYEATKGGYDPNKKNAYGLSNWGYNSRDPKSIEEAIAFFKQDFLPKVQQYPAGVKERMADYIYNTGRSPEDFLLYAAGKITLSQLNSPKNFTSEWNEFKPEIEKMMTDPSFLQTIDAKKADVYKTTKGGTLENPNPAFDATWSGRINMWNTDQENQQTTQGNPNSKVFIEERTSKKTGKKAYLYYDGNEKYLLDETGAEIPGSRRVRTAEDNDKPAIQTYTDEEKKVLKSMAPNLILPEDYVESLQKKGTTGTFGRFDKASADKNWGWYGKKINWNNPTEVGAAQEKYNKEMYNRFKNAGYTPEEASRYVNMIGFDKGIEKGPNALDSKAGKYTETRVLFDVPPKRKKEQAGSDIREMDQNVDLSAKRPDRSRPIGLYPQDIVNTVGALQNLYGINKYMPRQVQFTPEYVEPTYYDPTREIAANAEMANIAAQNLAQFTGPQAFNARYSDVQGKGLANAANIMGRYNNLNVGVANQFEMANKQLANEANFKNALAADDFYTKTAIANQQYDNARRQGREAVQQNIVGAMDNYFNTKLMNELYPQYYISPSSLSVQYDPQAALKLRPKTQTGNLDARLESMFPGYSNLEEQDKNPLRIAMLKAFTGDTSDSKDAFAAAAVRSKKK